MNRKVQDHYFQKAKKEKFLARSVYKLQEIDKKFTILRPTNNILELGHFPGSWIQYSRSKIGDLGLIIGIDIKKTNHQALLHKQTKLFQKNVFDLQKLQDIAVKTPFDVILSDMAPSASGIRSLDQDRGLALVESIFTLLPVFLKKNGNIVIKVFDSQEAHLFLKKQNKKFHLFKLYKPKATRPGSKEFFVIGKGYNGP